ncbi:hypothetical protein AB0D83_20195 [Streptomyces decoyicus]|uniref:hypothetical protein n=1 Tax=Streptomyces decoyicus TaxID=249567 RepID=UPI0033F43985
MAKLTKEQAKWHRQADALTRLGRGLTEDARAFVLEHWAEGAAAVAAGRTARHDENTPASPVEAEASEADARDRAAGLADMVAEAEVRARVQAGVDHEGAREITRHVFCGPDPRIVAR